MRVTVAVRHPQTLEAVAILAGDPVPDWALGLVDDGDVVEPKRAPQRAPK